MHIVFLAIGRLKGPEQELCDRYEKRITDMGRGLGLGKCSTLVLNEARGNNAGTRKKLEADSLLKKIGDKSVLIALDEHGKGQVSQKFAARIGGYLDGGASELVFALGGPDGHGEALLQRAQFSLSLSAMTMPHGLARAVLFEQVYRALTILGNHPYHRQ